MTAAVLLLAVALLTWPGTGLAARRLAQTVTPATPGARPDPVGDLAQALWRRLPEPVRRLPARIRSGRAIPAGAEDAWTVDLLAALLAAGLDPTGALRACGTCGSGQTARCFAAAATVAQTGVAAHAALARQRSESVVIAKVAAALHRSAHSGGSVSDALHRVAAWARAEEAARRQAAAERAGVLIAGPLGACFLPAFVCLGIAPVVIGLAGQILPEVLP